MAIGFCLGCCASSACCGGRKACKVICFGPRSCGIKPKVLPRLGYVMIQLIALSIGFLLMHKLRPAYTLEESTDDNRCLNDEAYSTLTGEELESQEIACYRTISILRMTFAMLAFHAIIILLTFLRNDFAAIIHDGAWLFKVMVMAGLYVGSFWLPFSVIKTWFQVSKYASIVY